MMLGGVTDAILLVALGLGYVVCYLAKREEKTMQAAGYLIGAFMIVLSGILIMSNLLLAAKFCGKISGKGIKGMLAPHRMMQQPSQPQK